MNEFESVLRDQVGEAGRTLTAARQAGHEYEVHLHASRIRDLLDLAEQHGIDTHDWIDTAQLESSGNGW